MVLTLAACAVLAGARSFVAVAEWAADLDPDTRAKLGLHGPVPSESTFRRLLQKLDADTFDACTGRGCSSARHRPASGAGTSQSTARPCAAPGGGSGPPLAGRDRPRPRCGARPGGRGAKTGESPRLPALLDTLELAGAVATADAAHAQRATATSLHTRARTTS